MPPFEFIVWGPPVSQQTRRRQRLEEWKEYVRAAARSYWPEGRAPFGEDLNVTILYFYEFAPMDVDNIAKPIYDALKGLVFEDDIQISDSIVRRRHLRGEFFMQGVSPVLAEGIDAGREFLYIRIDGAPIGGEIVL